MNCEEFCRIREGYYMDKKAKIEMLTNRPGSLPHKTTGDTYHIRNLYDMYWSSCGCTAQYRETFDSPSMAMINSWMVMRR